MKKFLRYQGPFLAGCLAIFIESSFSHVPLPPLPYLRDKIPHAIAFGTLTWLAFRAFSHQSAIRLFEESPLFAALSFAVLYGAMDEFHQFFVPGRSSDIWDLVADTVGAVIAVAIIRYAQRRSNAAAKVT